MLSRLMTRREQFVIGFLAVSIAVGALTLYVTQRRAERSQTGPVLLEEPPDTTPSVEQEPSDPANRDPSPTGTGDPAGDDSAAARVPEVVVSVQGAVNRPGVYTLPAGSRVHDLIQAAGGLSLTADTDDVNLAARLIDATTLTVPERRRGGTTAGNAGQDLEVSNPPAYRVSGQGGSAFTGGNPGDMAGAVPGLISINRASQAELETLPGIGPKLAQRIIQYRTRQPFRTLDELMEVSGIGEVRYSAIRDLVTLE